MKNKRIPQNIKNKVEEALCFFPSLENIHIEFKFKKNIKKSTMQAQPNFASLFSFTKPRSYYIYISEKFKITNEELKTTDIPNKVFTGWIGHELGHVLDYESMSNWQIIVFGIKYLLINKHIIEAERRADHYAVNQGMQDYIIETKNFILNHADISEAYKKRIKKYYLSPEEIMHLVNERNNVLKK